MPRLRGNLAAMTTTEKIKELRETRAQVASLEQAIEAELKRELAALPAQYGFASTADFVAAVTKAAGKRRGRKPGKAKVAAKPVSEPAVTVAPTPAPAAGALALPAPNSFGSLNSNAMVPPRHALFFPGNRRAAATAAGGFDGPAAHQRPTCRNPGS